MDSKQRGFTITELLVVIGITALIVLMLVPVRAGSRTKSQSLRCRDNFKQIMAAIMMYTADNHDFYPPNPDDGNTIRGHNWCIGSAGAGGQAEFNPELLKDPTRCLITTYIQTNITLFRCPSDPRNGIYQGNDPTMVGKRIPAVRSLAMNQAVGTICPSFDLGAGHSGKPTLSVNGPWLNHTHSHRRNAPWRTYGKVSETLVPGPSQLWVVLEEDEFSLNDASFAIGMNNSDWIDLPATRHELSCVFAFADGRVEQHKWVDPRTQTIFAPRLMAGPLDWAWMAQRTSARAQ